MGYYIEGPARGKGGFIKMMYSGMTIEQPKSFSEIPADKALIVVVDSGMFEAAGYAFDEREFKEFTDPSDTRPKIFILMDKELAERLSGRKK